MLRIVNSQEKKPGKAHSPGVRNEGLGRRCSVPSNHHLKASNIQFTALTVQKLTNDEEPNAINMDDDNDNNDVQVETLNLSSAPVATENIESSRNSTPISMSTSSDNINKVKNYCYFIY